MSPDPSSSSCAAAAQWDGSHDVAYGSRSDGKGKPGKGKKGKDGKGEGAPRGACHQFMSNGTCAFGDSCWYSHNKKDIAAAQKAKAGGKAAEVAEAHQAAKGGKAKKR